MAQVAISSDFLQAFARIPRSQQKRVRAFVEKFKADPTQASINYEPIHNMADDKVRTVRIDRAYRAIVIHPPSGDVYLMVWVDHHDEAMDWARRKRFEVNPRTGSFQVWQAVEGEPELTAQAPAPTRPVSVRPLSGRPVPADRLFSGCEDDALLLFGVPEPLLPAVRAVRVEADLDRLAKHLPAEANDALYMLAAGFSPEETLEELGRPKALEETIDVHDVPASLNRPGSQRQFKVVQDDAELAEMLDAPLELWRVFLHPSQRRIVQMHSSGSARVLGGAGTGKTVVAMHRAQHLAQKPGFLKPGERILLTTYTRNLAADIERSLALLCGAEREHIVVRNLNLEAARILESAGETPRLATAEQSRAAWEDALAAHPEAEHSPAFYRDEWNRVVQAQDVTDEKTYLRVRRVGRGTALSRAQRKATWQVLAAYRERLAEQGLMEHEDVVREARLRLLKAGRPPYRAVIADEVQDFRQADLDLLRALAPEADNDIFVVGDAHQRIYGHQASLQRSHINIRGRRSRRLRINYRTTQQIRAWAMAVLEGLPIDDLDEGQDDARGYHSLRVGKPPEVHLLPDAAAEGALIVQQVRSWLEPEVNPDVNQAVSPGDICVVARTRRKLAGIEQALNRAQIQTEHVQRDADSADRTKVRMATMHRIKGLEFRHVLIAAVHAGSVPLRLHQSTFSDPTAREMHLQGERHLLYVAATRARDELVITGHGKRSEFF